MYQYIFAVVLIFLTSETTAEPDLTFTIDKPPRDGKCTKEIIEIQENDIKEITAYYIHNSYAKNPWCTNDLSGERFDFGFYDSRTKEFLTILGGVEEHGGKWQCVYENDKSEIYYCTFEVRIIRDITLTVTSLGSRNAVRAKTNEQQYFDYRKGETVLIQCELNSYISTRSLIGSLTIKVYCVDKSANRVRTVARTNHLEPLIINTSECKNDTTTEIFCSYGKGHNFKLEAHVSLRQKPAKLVENHGERFSKKKQMRLTIRNSTGVEVTTFKNGDTLIFECLYGTFMPNDSIIELRPLGETFEKRDEAVMFKNVGYYRMNFTSHVIRSTCYISDFLITTTTLNRIDTDPNINLESLEKPTQRENREPSSDNTSLIALIGIGCVICVIIVASLFFTVKALRSKTKYTEHVYASVIYDTRDQQLSIPSLEAVSQLRHNREGRDSAKYVSMTPGVTPSVAHYLLPSLLMPKKKLCQQDNVTSESGYLTMSPRSSPAEPKAIGLENPYAECYEHRLKVCGEEVAYQTTSLYKNEILKN